MRLLHDIKTKQNVFTCICAIKMLKFEKSNLDIQLHQSFFHLKLHHRVSLRRPYTVWAKGGVGTILMDKQYCVFF